MVTSPGTPVAAIISSQLGWVCVVVCGTRVTATSLPAPTKKAAMAAVAPATSCRVPAAWIRGAALLEAVCDDMRRYLSGEPVDLARHPVDLSPFPPFYRRALTVARRIPYGEVRTYGWVAARAGRPRAARAAGQAMSRNTMPLLIPCHRVVAARGLLGGFGGGLALKRALLQLEGLGWDGPACPGNGQ